MASDGLIERELEHERIVSAELGPQTRAIPTEMWDFGVTMSQRAGTAAVMGVYGRAVQADEALITRAFSEAGLTDDEIAELETLRPVGEKERFGKDGVYGWVD